MLNKIALWCYAAITLFSVKKTNGGVEKVFVAAVLRDLCVKKGRATSVTVEFVLCMNKLSLFTKLN